MVSNSLSLQSVSPRFVGKTRIRRIHAAIVICLIRLCEVALPVRSASADELTFDAAADRIEIKRDGKHFATYVFRDPEIARPYYCNLMTRDEVKVTRNHPLEPTDSQDHTFHSGLFFSFGDLNGIDYWHMNAPCEHVRFVEPPTITNRVVRFKTEETYLNTEGRRLATEHVAHRILVTPEGTRIDCDVTLSAFATALLIGSKEEGGLAVRVATPIAVKAGLGGQMVDDVGRVNGDAIWGQQAQWVVYSAQHAARQVGVQLMTHPANARPSFWHARDYGLLVANPFGPLNKPTGGMVIAPHESVTLRFALLVFSTDRDARELAKTAFLRFTAEQSDGR